MFYLGSQYYNTTDEMNAIGSGANKVPHPPKLKLTPIIQEVEKACLVCGDRDYEQLCPKCSSRD